MNKLDKDYCNYPQDISICNYCNGEMGRITTFKDYTMYCPLCFAPHKIIKGEIKIINKK
jgi:hypothetical protein